MPQRFLYVLETLYHGRAVRVDRPAIVLVVFVGVIKCNGHRRELCRHRRLWKGVEDGAEDAFNWCSFGVELYCCAACPPPFADAMLGA